MNINKIIIILGEPKSVFLEILFKFFKSNKFKKINQHIILIGSKDLVINHMNKVKSKIKLNIINDINLSIKKYINIINVNYNSTKKISKLSSGSNFYIKKSFAKGLDIVKKNKKVAMFNGPISKKHFLKKKYLGITEYLGKKTKSKNTVMLIYNKKFSVSPITTHIPIKNVAKNISKKKIISNILNIDNFYKKKLKTKPLIGVLGLNPHCESIEKASEEEKIISPAIKILKKKKIKIYGPFSADTFFLKKNINKYDVVVGMYHDQVLGPLKTLYNFNAINLTLGLPFIRISPDHGPNSDMVGKNKSDPSSIFTGMDFFQKIK
tara:strand:- start:1678 stop:2643 length:966 start_codon:yes stop_codon:yes gene_type:complete